MENQKMLEIDFPWNVVGENASQSIRGLIFYNSSWVLGAKTYVSDKQRTTPDKFTLLCLSVRISFFL
jgi:hypothetical protein